MMNSYFQEERNPIGKMSEGKRKRRKIRISERIIEQKTFQIVKEMISLLEEKDPRFKKISESLGNNGHTKHDI